MNQPLTIWANAALPADAMELLKQSVVPHKLLMAAKLSSILAASEFDPALSQADIAFGQPDPQQVIASPRLKWIHLTTAGYSRYDTPEFHAAIKSRSGIFSNSSSVFSEPCAQHLLAMILGLARQLPQALGDQLKGRSWPIKQIRAQSHLLNRQTAIIYGMGSIARRLIELLTPLQMQLIGVRRSVGGNEPIRTVTPTDADALLFEADHIIDVLPASPQTEGFFNAERFAKMKPGAIFYNIGRGTSVDQVALQQALESGPISSAYLDVTTPEPLPADHPLWFLPNCFITPHTAGGHSTEFMRIVEHFVNNLRRFETGGQIIDRVI